MPYYDVANLLIVKHKYLNETNIINEMACGYGILGTTGKMQLPSLVCSETPAQRTQQLRNLTIL